MKKSSCSALQLTGPFRLRVLALMCSAWCCASHARNYTFDAAMLGSAAQGVDMSLFSQGVQQPGTYMLDVMINGERVDTREVTFSRVSRDDRAEILPCITEKMLSVWGVNTAYFAGMSQSSKDLAGGCVSLGALSQVKTVFDLASQQLRLSIPQAAMRPKFRGLAPEPLWDDGIMAFRMNYRTGASHTDLRATSGSESHTSWLQLSPGINAGAWRVRSLTDWKQNSGQPGRWQTAYTYAERGIRRLKSRFTAGESTSPSDVTEGVPFTGMMLATDESMVPFSQRSFAPAVRGIARTQARVEIRKDGYVIYTTTVAPGPFSLQDFSVSSGGGELGVTVYEADGSRQEFTVPWQTPAIALHEGFLKYSLAAGRYRPADRRISRTELAQGSLMYGLPYNTTLYGGFTGAGRYQAGILGAGVSLGYWGSLSADVTSARSSADGEEPRQGSSWRLRYSNQLPGTGTGFSFASWQYTSPGYRSLRETLDSLTTGGNGRSVTGRRDDTGRQRSRTELSLSQSLAGLGSVRVNGSHTQWRDAGRGDNTWGLSWGTSLYGASLNVNWQRSRVHPAAGRARNDTVTSLWLSIPLGGVTGQDISASWRTTAGGKVQSHDAGLSGNAFDRRLSWNVQQQYRDASSQDRNMNSFTGMTWSGAYGEAGANYFYSESMRQAGVSVAGGVLAHRHGITFSQPLGDTVALIEAPGVAGAKAEGWTGVRTDFRGYTASSGLRTYQDNTVSLDPTSLPADAEILQTDARVVPTRGAVVEARFRTRTGGRALMTVQRRDGRPVPFGAQVTVEGQEGSAGLVDSGGQAYLTGLPSRGILKVSHGPQVCRVSYRLPARPGDAGLYQMKGVCE